MDNKERFITLCRTIQRDGMDDLMDWVKASDFYTAPASTRFHGAYAGGLLQHSLNVYDELRRLLNAYPEIKCSDESAVICALFHDFCKVNFMPQRSAIGKTNSDNGKVTMRIKWMKNSALEDMEASQYSLFSISLN